MDIDIRYIPSESDRWDVTKAIASVLHQLDFGKIPELNDRPVNFQVKLNESKLGESRNNGSGTLTFPSLRIAQKFLKWIRCEDHEPIRVNGKKLKFYSGTSKPPPGLVMSLEKTPFINPDLEKERQGKVEALQEALRIDKIQIGLFYRDSYPRELSQPAHQRAFSVEWEQSHTSKCLGWLQFEYDHKLIRAKLGDPMTEQIGHSIAIAFSSISKLAMGYDMGTAYLLFDTLTPPVYEQIDFNRDETVQRQYRRRVGSLHPGHASVAPYAHHLRIVLYNDTREDVIRKFAELCQVAGLAPPLDCTKHKITIDASRRGFFTPKRLYQFRNWVKVLEWPVAFQLESLLHNALLNTEELLSNLYAPINNLCKEYGALASEVLRLFNVALQSSPPQESPLRCFERVRSQHLKVSKPRLPAGAFVCHHVTFTPTRLILEGPYATQSNRVIREFKGFEENFVRVDFRDEDRLQYRWDREMDGSSYLDQRVGGTLKNGFELAGRDFEFLAYSSSALREHAVWFMHPFHHPEKGFVTSAAIRNSLGNFKKVIKQPSKYAARLAQAFTATDPSVRIQRSEWEEMPDLGDEPYLFTDGVGTISKELGDKIWETLSANRHDRGLRAIKPSAYQIRFLGYKGMVAVDEQLTGIKMRLRPSMNKFSGNEEGESEIEIARAFDYPNKSYLNRPLVMVLEDRGVRRDAFVGLQEAAVAQARMIHDSIDKFLEVLNSHSLGGGFRLRDILKFLSGLGLDINSSRGAFMDNAFYRRLRDVAMNHVLRDIKHGARIQIPKAHHLVGIADEGPAYEQDGHPDVYCLPEGHIYACVQNFGDEAPTWLKGQCTISRSPVVHPGDVQRVRAIGQPPEGKLCLFRHMKNVVVLPSVGKRSLASCLGGGDLDGDQYDVIQDPSLLPMHQTEAAKYPPGETRTLADRDSTIEDICDFVVEYVKSDILGLLSDRHLVIADQSKEGTHDPACLKLARLCSQAVDYPKNGVPVDIDSFENRLPALLIRCKPDWKAAEVVSPRGTDYYESSRALGYLYRGITLNDPAGTPEVVRVAPLSDPISLVLKPLVQRQLYPYQDPNGNSPEITKVFSRYAEELRYICSTHTISNTPGVRLLEEEVVIGTILAKCSQRRWRTDRMYRMRLHASVLVREVKEELRGEVNQEECLSENDKLLALGTAWVAWDLSIRKRAEFGAQSFGLIALGVILDCLGDLPNGLSLEEV